MGDSAGAPPVASPLQGRRIQLREATPADIAVILDIHYSAFRGGPMQIILHPRGLTEDAKAKFASSIFPGDSNDGGFQFVHIAELVGEDGSNPEPVAWAKWKIFRKERSREEWDVEEPPLTDEMLGEGVNADAFNAFIGRMHAEKKKYIKGEKHLHLGLLACSPKYGRLGAGGTLIRRGLELADAEGLPTYLEASPEGYGLYKRNGFQDVWAFDLDITKRWGRVQAPGEYWGEKNGVEKCGPCPEGGYRTVGMKRPAKAA